MFSKSILKIASVFAIILSGIGLFLSLVGAFFLQQAAFVPAFFFGVISWGILLWSSIIGYKLVTKYKLYEEEYKKVGFRIYAIIAAFILFMFVGLVAGIIISVSILGSLWSLKKNYDEWADNQDVDSIGSELQSEE